MTPLRSLVVRPPRTDSPAAQPAFAPAAFSVRRTLDLVEGQLRAESLDGLDDLVAALDHVRRSLPAPEWARYVAEDVAGHPVLALLREEPFTRRAYEKPRGYAGDAPMLDLIYGDAAGRTSDDSPARSAPPTLGARLAPWAVRRPAPRSVRARRDLLARLIDRVAAERPAPRMLSVACGHLREAQWSAAVCGGGVAEFVAVDQDPASLAVVAAEQGHLHVRPARASVRRLLAAPAAYGTFDLAYAAGLYDYLTEPVGRALTAALFGQLRPGGVLVVANFAPELGDIGYMEAVMEWQLIYRDEALVRALAADLPPAEVAGQRVYRDGPGNVVYLEVQRG